MTASTPAPLLSIVTPFFNAAGKADRLLATLTTIGDRDVELIFVDDGSTDGTLSYLAAHKAAMQCPCAIVRQDNMGPGGAKNHGLSLATGRYVWFVDCDDDINPSVIADIRSLQRENYDFIDFDVKHFADRSRRIRPSEGLRAAALDVAEGGHSAGTLGRVSLLRSVGWLWSKVFRRDFLISNGFWFPEHCVYEDTVWFFWLPLAVDRFYKSHTVGYYHHQERESITRSLGRKSPRFYDRLLTATLSVQLAGRYHCAPDEQLRIAHKFRAIFWIHTVQMLRRSREWAMILRVTKLYREEARRLGIPSGLPWDRRRTAALLVIPWLMSYFCPSQRPFFQSIRRRAWTREISFPEPFTIGCTASASRPPA